MDNSVVNTWYQRASVEQAWGLGASYHLSVMQCARRVVKAAVCGGGGVGVGGQWQWVDDGMGDGGGNSTRPWTPSRWCCWANARKEALLSLPKGATRDGRIGYEAGAGAGALGLVERSISRNFVFAASFWYINGEVYVCWRKMHTTTRQE